MPESPSPAPPRRADAVRNLAAIRTAAREELARHGVGVSMGAIARAAGVAVGTLYRHFPTKADLLSAVMSEHVEELALDAESALSAARAGAAPGRQLEEFLQRVVESTARNQAIKAAVAGAGREVGDAGAERRGAAAVDELLDLARQAGHMAADVTVADIYLLISTVPADRSPQERVRWGELVLRGLRAG